MKYQHRAGRAGFALTELGVAIAITIVIGAFSAPSLLRAHLRLQASQTLKIMREIESAKELYAAKNGIPDGVIPSCTDLLPFVRQGSPAAAQLAANRVHDVLGRPIVINAIGQMPQLNTVSRDQFAPAVEDGPPEFWGEFGQQP